MSDMQLSYHGCVSLKKATVKEIITAVIYRKVQVNRLNTHQFFIGTILNIKGKAQMVYIFKGRLCGLICAECPEPLSNVTVRLYRTRYEQNLAAFAVAAPKDTFAILSDEMVEKKSSLLIAETDTDAEGNFVFDLGENQHYGGEAFEVDVYCKTVPHQKIGLRPPRPLQFSITTLQPRWRQTENGLVAIWDYCLPYRLWCAVRARFGVWTICGRLTTCQEHLPIPGATVRAFDVDWLQDDPLGFGVTDATGRFRIDYATEDFQKTPFSPLINIEWVSGPDLYFTVELGGVVILNEDRSVGRTPGRENVGHCFCVELCTDAVQPSTPEQTPHWQRVWDFDIHPAAPNPASAFSVEGFAGGAANSFVFGGGVPLRGNCPLVNAAVPSNALEYRFLIGEWTWPGGVEDPGAIASVPPASLTPVVSINPTNVGWVFYTNGLSLPDSAPVNITSSDISSDGWIKLNGKAIAVDMRDGTTSTVNIAPSNFLRSIDLIVLNSNAITAVHPPKLPSGLPKSEAGRALTVVEKEPIRRYRLQFEVRDSVTLSTIFTDTLNSIVLDNSPAILALDLEELRLNACNPVSGAANVHILYTIDHPHLRFFTVKIINNNGLVHDAPPLPNGNFSPPPPLNFFRGGAGGPHQSNGLGGFPVNIAGDPPCAYSVTLSWQTRHYLSIPSSTQILYCK